jgi:hypothetical protein
MVEVTHKPGRVVLVFLAVVAMFNVTIPVLQIMPDIVQGQERRAVILKAMEPLAGMVAVDWY